VTATARSRAEPPFDLVARDAFPTVEFGQAGLDLRQEDQAFYRVVDTRVDRQLAQRQQS